VLLQAGKRGALSLADDIESPLYRAVALCAVAEAEGDRSERLRVLQLAFDAADQCQEPHPIVACACWPLHALAKRGEKGRVEVELERLRQVIATEHHPLRRMNGMWRLFCSAAPSPPDIGERIFEETLDTIDVAEGWRRERMIWQVATWLIERGEVHRGWALVDRTRISRQRRRTLRLLVPRFGPRPA
jgi:hypothetical protein